MTFSQSRKKFSLITSLFAMMTLAVLSGCQSAAQPNHLVSDNPPTAVDNSINTLPTTQYSAADRASYQAAMELKDSKYCQKIVDKNYQQSCKNELADAATLAKALAKNDPKLCDKLLSKDNLEACKITIEANLQKTQQQKDQETQIQVQQKLRDEIIATGDYTRCKEITDENFRSVCELQILSNKVFATRDQTWCEKASTSELVAKCKDIVK